MKSESKTTALMFTGIVLVVILILVIRTSCFQHSFRIPGKDLWTSQRIQETLPDPNSQSCAWWEIFDLSRNSPATQKTLALILLIPFGVLITACCRNLIGLRTIGTFSPTLLAISQVKADWKVGVVVFLLTFGVGSFVRMFLLKYKLSSVPRRGIIAVFVVLSLAVAITVSERFQLATSARHILLPVVVTTTMIESFFVILEKESKVLAIRVLFNTLLVTFFCFVIFSKTTVGAIILIYPELELLVVAALFLIGRYSGCTLIEFVCPTKTGPIEQEV